MGTDKIHIAAGGLEGCRRCIIGLFPVACKGIGGIYEQLRVILHQGEVRHGRKQSKAAPAAAENDGDLGNDPGSLCLLCIDQAKGVEGVHSLLKAQACGIDQADHGCARLDGQAVQLDDFFSVHLADAAPGNVGILAVDIDQPSIYQSVSCDNTVGGLSDGCSVKICSPGPDQRADLNKAVCVEQRMNPLYRY